MQSPARIDLAAERWGVFRRTFAFVGYNFTGAAFKMQLRQVKDVGAALVTLTTQTTDVQGVWRTYTGTDTIANHLAAARLSQEDVNALLAARNAATGANFQLSDSILLSIVAVRIDKATISAIATTTSGADVPLFYDLHIIPSGGDEDVYVKGGFTILAGATQ